MATDLAPRRARAILCGGVAAGRLPIDDPNPLRLAIFGLERNVNLKIQEVSQELTSDIPEEFLDLLDLAAYVYAADQATSRGGQVAENLGQRWRRRLCFRVPVRRPEFWSDPVTSGLLTDVLSFLTEDEYLLEFRPIGRDKPSFQRYLDFGMTPYTGEIDDVVMFSGGLDSLAGAVEESVIQKRRVILVNHRPSSKLAQRQLRLVERLSGRAGRSAPMFIPVWANKSEGLTRDYTQRSRSFLFAALGATVATMVGRNRLRFYENGVVSLNLPISAQVVGGRASRTTHPRVLAGLARLISRVSGKPFAIENDFLDKTKTDVVRLIADAECQDLLSLSTSCGHTWTVSNERTHCGDCSQCIDRRFAVLAAGQAAHDPAGAYDVDLFTGERSSDESRLLLAGYLETVNQVGTMDAREFFVRFGELGQVVRHVPGVGPEVAGRRAFELYRRHAGQVNEVVTAAIRNHAEAIRQRTLPATCLLVQVTGSAANGADTSTALTDVLPGDADNYFRRHGDAWVVRFAKGERNILLATTGATYLHRLLCEPGRSFTALALACADHCQERVYAPGAGIERLDSEGLRVLRARYEELRDELAAASTNGDKARAEKISEEMDAIARELGSARGLGLRRRLDNDEVERPRKAVGNAVRRTLVAIRRFDPRLADHLRAPVLTIGSDLRYDPPSGVVWHT